MKMYVLQSVRDNLYIDDYKLGTRTCNLDMAQRFNNLEEVKEAINYFRQRNDGLYNVVRVNVTVSPIIRKDMVNS